MAAAAAGPNSQHAAKCLEAPCRSLLYIYFVIAVKNPAKKFGKNQILPVYTLTLPSDDGKLDSVFSL